MDEQTPRSLNLDELFGLDRKIKVVFEKKEYELFRPEALSIEEWLKFSDLNERTSVLQTGDLTTISKEQAIDLEKVVNECIGMICPELAKAKLPFFLAMKVLNFYSEQVKSQELPEGKSKNAKKPTGERPSAG